MQRAVDAEMIGVGAITRASYWERIISEEEYLDKKKDVGGVYEERREHGVQEVRGACRGICLLAERLRHIVMGGNAE